ncbi:hypothetical protein BJ138DRAFT_1012358 [Hygrophoropsis aurantiaca]|uniref:Uncharacterized protein n=1 Tax=Hygrophoropsis aurantiaca TaxID=72124 RepID=A0ACB8A6J3_9AGAM|nr:hypothetical protein BJ138DRAFT_1012358 [Hygrophoropsis aurantiaca]
MTAALPQIPLPDHRRYRWQEKSDAGLYAREAGGGEVVCDIQNRAGHGELTLFAGVECVFTPNGRNGPSVLPNSDTFTDGLRTAWSITRFEVPTIAAKIAHDGHGAATLTYQTLQSQDQAEEWAQHTVVVQNNTDIDCLREELSATVLPNANGDHVLLYAVLGEDTFDLLLHSHHALIDGVGSKLLFTFLLKQLVRILDGSLVKSTLNLQWGAEAANLCPCAYDHEVLSHKEVKDGPDYQRTLMDALQSMMIPPSHQVAFPSRHHGIGRTGQVELLMSPSETASILKLCREQAFTVNALVHAALALTFSPQVDVHEHSPPSDPDPLFVFTHLANSRSRLAPRLSEPVGYTGYCLTYTAITIPSSLVPAYHNAQEADPASIYKLASHIGLEYAKQKAYPSLQAVGAHMVEYYRAMATSSSVRPPNLAPGYTGDGVAENHLEPSYLDAHGKPFLQVKRTLTSVQTNQPGPTFRAWSWKDQLTLGVDYSKFSWSDEEIRALMTTWAAFLRRSVMT